MAFSWLPLELWRAGALAQETKAAIMLYEQVANAGDGGALRALRSSIERRTDELEAFYVRASDDERAVLFEKQRLKLRKLLHEYDEYAAAVAQQQEQQQQPGSPSAAYEPGPLSPAAATSRRGEQLGASTSSLAAGGGVSGGVTTRVIREDTRLTLPELTAWFEQAGADEMPEVSSRIVARVFASITRTNSDGKLSVRDLRQWYITFGRHTLAAAAAAGRDPEDALEASSDARADGGVTIVSVPVMRSLNVHMATSATRGIMASRAAGGGSRGGGAGSRLPVSSSSVGGGVGSSSRPLYQWEQQQQQQPGEQEATPGGAREQPPLGGGSAFGALPNGLLEFQVRLTPEEHAAVGRLRRALDAEARFKARMDVAYAKAAAVKTRGFGGVPGGAGGDGSWQLERDAWEEPLARDAAALLSRSA